MVRAIRCLVGILLYVSADCICVIIYVLELYVLKTLMGYSNVSLTYAQCSFTRGHSNAPVQTFEYHQSAICSTIFDRQYGCSHSLFVILNGFLVH